MSVAVRAEGLTKTYQDGARRVASHEQKPFALCHAAPDDLPEPTVC